MQKIYSVGLTGGIASGKSAVSARLAEHGALIIDADLLARQVLEPGSPGLDEVVSAFGDALLTESGELDRAGLGQIVFADEEARVRLNAIVHPRVRAEASRLRAAAPEGSVVVEDIPLLVETGQQGRFDLVLVVQTPERQRIERIMRDRGATEEEARSRIAAQATDAQRAAAADVILDNSGTLDELHRQVDELYEKLQSRVTAQQ
ncbi:dephospho-CoA kinase [Nesterenkonia lutea]|uniref:Dephospho-CoA kinase n=1 Tax=Nesterenkonia lutea TaxID=272919 RepID=A0ABR9JED7_9MICC|nr:dephospho-CoA kinase [Nesterenkonia lutea]MBE1524143.1 dephospho-CoA kinase [Nesterenkonia lutea]